MKRRIREGAKLIVADPRGNTIAVLSGIEPADFVGAVERRDVARLTRVPGVGKKTAERIVLELRDRLAKLTMPAAGAGSEASASNRLRDDLLSALVNLGYQQADIG